MPLRARLAPLMLALAALACREGPGAPETAQATGPRCGDGVVTPPETCDDGNATGGDGCSATCQRELDALVCPGDAGCPQPKPGEWTFMAGSAEVGPVAVGQKGVPSADARPWSSICKVATWVDHGGRLWLFGGFANKAGGAQGYLADLWMFDGARWTWVDGPGALDARSVRGPLAVATPTAWPGGRCPAATWVDVAGDLWLFGGGGIDDVGAPGPLNDWWRFDGRAWAWMGGGTRSGDPGSRGALGVPDPSNTPAARYAPASWVDARGALWVFGGQGLGQGTYPQFADLWRFDGSAWTWMGGSAQDDYPGNYGTRGVPSPSNAPAGRFGGVGWVGKGGDLWLYGGYWARHDLSAWGDLDDLWRWDGTSWTWVGGSSTVSEATSFDPANPWPGARREAVTWTDAAGRLWMFGGGGYVGWLNELWRFDGERWAFLGGSANADALGVYGTRGVPAPTNRPGARMAAGSWVDPAGDLWLYGGFGLPDQPVISSLGDLWRYRPAP